MAGGKHLHLRTPGTTDSGHESDEAAGSEISPKLLIDVFESSRKVLCDTEIGPAHKRGTRRRVTQDQSRAR